MDASTLLRDEQLEQATVARQVHEEYDARIQVLRRSVALEFDAAIWPSTQARRKSHDWLAYLKTGPVWDTHGTWAQYHDDTAESRKLIRGRSIQAIANEFESTCPQEVEAVKNQFHQEARNAAAAAVAHASNTHKIFDIKMCQAAAEQERTFHARASRTAIELPTPIVLRLDAAPLIVPVKRCLHWLGCPQACVLASISMSALLEVSSIATHCGRCPAARSCEVCGFSLAPSLPQVSRLNRHRRFCSAWQVDGRLWRCFLAPPISLPAGMAHMATRKALQVFEAGDFPGVDRSVLSSNAPVCCPHYGCDAAFDGRELAMLHAAHCTGWSKPPYCIHELKAALT